LGLANKHAAELADVSEAAFYLWINRGKEELERVAESNRRRIRKREKPYVDFVHALRRARAERRDVLLKRIHEASKPKDYEECQVVEKREQRRGRDGELYELVTREEKIIERHDTGQWQAAAWLLERIHPEEFGRRVDVTSRGESVKFTADDMAQAVAAVNGLRSELLAEVEDSE
jgi:hypothetical protein